ncbi:acyl-CoA dehydrogenase family protein [Blastococcus litoris]|uniref:acyl-CoA dehydrogenase family protein n=1 Tax=Blastococcus litoris TaxID=2171622 RepID=UPI0019CFDC55|nr:acyl-CoA dehydrogenase family protein [Blastococcus litoris]
MTLDFDEGDELRALRSAVADLGSRYGQAYFLEQARSGGRTDALWAEAGKAGFLGVNLPEEHGGGGGGMVELSIVLEELGAAGCPLLMMVVSPAICGTVIGRFGTPEQKDRWLPGLADGSTTMGFAITEPDAGSNSHEITTVARRDGDGWVLRGQKVWISGVDQADALLVVGRLADGPTGTLRPALFVVPTDAPGLTASAIPMEIVSPERQFQVFLDDVRLPDDALVGHPDQGIAQLFAGLNPERVMAAAYSLGVARLAMRKATEYARERQVWGTPIGAHQGLAHPLAACQIEIECARLMTQKAAWLIDAGQDAGLAANSAKYAAAEAAVHAVDQAIQTHGGNGLSQEYGVAALLAMSRVSRIAPVSREMILSFVAQHDLRLPRSY